MKKILLISDNHGYIDPALDIHMKASDEIWHAGDIGSWETVEWMESFGKIVRGVYGNIDDASIRQHYPEDNIFTIESVKVWMTHIAGYPSRYSSRVRSLIPSIEPMLIVCGHSHIVKLEHDKKFQHWVFNPGACGHHGFHTIRTALTFDIEENNIRNVEVIHLGKRGR